MPDSQDFGAKCPQFHKNRMNNIGAEEKRIQTTLSDLYAGIAVDDTGDDLSIGLAIHDGTYSIDFAILHLPKSKDDMAKEVQDLVVSKLSEYRDEHCCKILGAGVGTQVHEMCPKLASTLWAELDIVPWVLNVGIDLDADEAQALESDHPWSIDEQADSLVRKCIMFWSPTTQPRIVIGYKSNVLVDSRYRIHLTTTKEYQKTVGEATWKATMKYVEDLKKRNVRIVFFNATPQGGGVALMRHALLRFLRPLGVSVEWFVPKPRPDVFRITKTNHNILQGVVDPSVRQGQDKLKKIKEWVDKNANSGWLSDGGPLAARSKGGADVIIVDDPQMPELIPLAKKADPDRPVIFRSHIQVRDDLVGEEGSAAQEVWQDMWKNIKQADLFISHPVKDFVPEDVKPEAVGYMPATTDWLDGLNKTMRDFDVDYYLHEFNSQCKRQGIPELAYPRRGYICQIARFDPAKGIPDVIKGYAVFRQKLSEESEDDTPQLVVCGHSSVDDPDGSMVFDQIMDLIDSEFTDLKDDIIVVRLGPSDQILNAIISKADIVLQLSTREGFEVKVSEALHKGKPVITTKAGGIPLQVTPDKNGFLVAPNDFHSVALRLHDLWTKEDMYGRMSDYALKHVSDEVSTVGNALCWTYLASRLSKGEEVKPGGKWVNDMAREDAGEPYKEGEPRLPRNLTT